MGTVQYNVIKDQLEDVICFLEPFVALMNSHLVDYFTESLFNSTIPADIRTEVNNCNHIDLINSIFNGNCPVKLNEFVQNCRNFSLYNCKDVCLNLNEFQKLLKHGFRDISGFKLEIFMNPKKCHEVEVLGTVAAAINKISETSHLIDIGDGRGYLSSMLALYHKIPVLGIDSSAINTNSAGKRASMLEKRWTGVTKHLQNEQKRAKSGDLYKQITQFVTEETDFPQLIQDVFLQKSTRIGLVGLHTCGDLTPTSLKIFIRNKEITTICNVGCCYHLLTEQFDDNHCINDLKHGFPMSEYLKGKRYSLGRCARMLAAQSTDRILNKKGLPNRTIFYRAVLQVLLVNPSLTIGRMKGECTNFVDYCHKAFKKINNDFSVSDHDLESVFESYEKFENELNLFYLIRSMLSSVIECVILLDRLLFLHENGFENSHLVQLFDPVISPRCYGIVAFKDM